MGEAGHKPLFDLDAALERGNLSSAWYAAVEAGVIYLDQLLLITILLGEEGSPRFEAAARKFMIRFMREVEPKPKLEQVKTVSEALYVIGDEDSFSPDRGQAGKWMADLARQLKERRRP